MEARGKEVHPVHFDLADETVLLFDTPRPFAAELSPERPGLARPAERLPEHGIDEPKRSQRPARTEAMIARHEDRRARTAPAATHSASTATIGASPIRT